MCVICVKPRGVESPDGDTFEKMFDKNPDGAGFMWVRGGKVHVRKGFMEFSDFMDAWEKFDIQKGILAVAHFRIGTSGGKTEAMTHPFPVSDDPDTLKQTVWDGDMALAHNGVLGSGRDDLSDTALFVKEIVHPIREKLIDNDGQFDDSMKPLLSSATDSNRVVMINDKGSLISLGDWDKMESGIFVSNKLWDRVSQTTYTTGNSNYYNGKGSYTGHRGTNYRGNQATSNNKSTNNKSKSKSSSKTKSTNTKSKSKTKSKAKTDRVKKIRDETSVYEIPGAVAVRLMKMGLVLKKKANNNTSNPSFYRWNDKEEHFEIYWAGRKEVQWRSSDVDMDRMTFLFPNYQEEIDKIYDRIEEMDDYLAYQPFENVLSPLTDFDDDDPLEMDRDLNETTRACRVLDIRHQELDILINELQNLLYTAGQLTSDLMERRNYVEELKDSAEAHKVEVHKDFYQYRGRLDVDRDSVKKIADKLEGTRAPLLSTAVAVVDVDSDSLCPGQLRKDLYDIGYRPCHRCLKWRKFEEEGVNICEECKS